MLGWFKRKLKKREETPAPEAPETTPASPAAETPPAPSTPAEVVPETPPESAPETAPEAVPEPAVPDAVPEAVPEAGPEAGGAPPPEPATPAATPTAAAPAAPAETPPPPEGGAGEGEKPRRSLFARLAARLGKTRQSLVSRMDALFAGRKRIDEELYEELEEILITADLGVRTTQELLDEARRRVRRDALQDPAALKEVLRDILKEYLMQSERPAELVLPESGPFVIMVLGVNGVGKTTTIGKLAWKFKQSGQEVLLVAADTFRAAAIDQLKVWAQRVGVDIVAQQQGSDPSAVAFDALDHALARGYDVVIIDTAGRLHTKVNLMEELKKINRVIGRKIPGAPHETMLVVDATTGQNGIAQARLFNEATPVTGLALTKLDGTAKGGIVVNICRELGIPIRFIGIGEQMEDLRDFDAGEFIDALFAGNGTNGTA